MMRSYREFIADIRSLRAAITVGLSAFVIAPSFLDFVHQELSPVQVLARFAESLIVVGALVWVTTSILLHYAKTQARTENSRHSDEGMTG